jgi:hypothetical protein
MNSRLPVLEQTTPASGFFNPIGTYTAMAIFKRRPCSVFFKLYVSLGTPDKQEPENFLRHSSYVVVQLS